MGNKWRKKMALGLNLCAYVPRVDDNGEEEEDGPSPPTPAVKWVSDVTSSSASSAASEIRAKSGSRSSKKTCSICLGTIKAGHGQAIFTGECSHSFHFHCIASNVKHGNLVCPVCRAKWKEVPFQCPQTSDHSHGRARVSPVNWVSPQQQNYSGILQNPRVNPANRQHSFAPSFHSPEPDVFDDDEPLNLHPETSEGCSHRYTDKIEIKIFPEFSAIPQSASEDNFTVLIHLKAPTISMGQVSGSSPLESSASLQTARAPVDLVAVLDTSGSMSGTKIALLKRAMGFVIQNLGPSDRLSVIAFSSTARRVFNLRRMSESGRQHALQAVNSLVASGGTNILEGLKKGGKVIEERQEKNPVCSVILLSDGQDTYNINSSADGSSRLHPPNYRALLPASILSGTSYQIPVHTFGFGADHDSIALHLISEDSGGTFSFIEAEAVIQDAFAQCIGGLLSVVAQEVLVAMNCKHTGVQIVEIKSGSYASEVDVGRRKGGICVGDLYAEEERDFLVTLHVPPSPSGEDTTLLTVCCLYQNPLSKEIVHLGGQDILLQRPETIETRTMSIEVDRQRNRLLAAEAMSGARVAAEHSQLSEAVFRLENCRRAILESVAGQTGDRMCLGLDAELREMQERMANQQRYELSGRAYVLSGLSSHSWQRATARGDSTEVTTMVHAYQTPSMTQMLERSQVMSLRSRPAKSPPSQTR